MPIAEPSFTFGIEEEYHLVDRASRDLSPVPPALLAACERELGNQVSPEFLATQIEVGTSPATSIAAAAADLMHLRQTVARLAGEHGLAPLAAAIHPFAKAVSFVPTDKARYRALSQDLAGVGRRLSISGMHVHVGIEDRELRIDLMNQVRYFLPHLLVLSASSPFWEGEDTGLDSFRLALAKELPRTGMPGRLAGWDEYERTVDILVKAKVIEDATKIWWDVRPSARFPTLEMRITDVCTRARDGLAIAGLFVCICRMLWRQRRANLTWRTYPVFLLEENRWRAQRYGLGGSLFDLGRGELVPFPELLDELLGLVAEDAAALGCSSEIAHTRTILTRGSSAMRQRASYAAARKAGADHRDALLAVVDDLLAETTAPD